MSANENLPPGVTYKDIQDLEPEFDCARCQTGTAKSQLFDCECCGKPVCSECWNEDYDLCEGCAAKIL